MARAACCLGLFVLAAGLACCPSGCSSAGQPEALRERITIFAAGERRNWWTDWSWNAKLERPTGPGGLQIEIGGHGGVAWRDPRAEIPLRLPSAGYLVLVLGEEPRPDLVVSLHDGRTSDLEPRAGISLANEAVLAARQEPGRWRLCIPLRLYSPARARLGKINLINASAQPVRVTVYEVALVPVTDVAGQVVQGNAAAATAPPAAIPDTRVTANPSENRGQ